MTVPTENRLSTHIGNGITKDFTFNFNIPESGAEVVLLEEIATGVQVELTLGQYSITGFNDVNGGVVTYPVSGAAIENTHKILITRDTPQTQTTSVSNQTAYFPGVVEAVWDKLTLMIQDVKARTSRAVLTPEGVFNTQIIPGNEGDVPVWNDDQDLVPGVTITQILEAEDWAALARKFAENPEDVFVDNSEYPGEYSARHFAAKAGASATDSASSASASATSASASAGSASSAATSASTAAAEATDAGNSASAAATSASNAATSATNAASAETGAISAASDAASAESAAATSASNASTSEGTAASSATAAATSATNSANSETAAANSATAAANSATEAQGYADTWAGVGTIATQDADAVDIDGGSIDGTPIGASTPATGAFTGLSSSGDLAVGTDKLFVDVSSGRVGVNKPNPAVPFHVLGHARIEQNGAGETIQSWQANLGVNTRIASLMAPEADSGGDPFIFLTGNSWLFRVDSTDALLLDNVGQAVFGNNTEIKSNFPNYGLTELDTNTFGRLMVTGGVTLLQAGEAGEGNSSSSGDIRFSGIGAVDAHAFQVRKDSNWRNIIYDFYPLDFTAVKPGGAFFSNDPGGAIQPVLRQAGRAFFGPDAYDFTGATRNNNPTANSWVHSGDEGNNFFNPSATTTLDAAIGDANSFISITDSSDFPISGHARIDDEIVYYTGVNYTTHTLTGAVRGQLGTTAAAHSNGADIHAELSPYGSRIQYAQTNARVYSEANGGLALSGAATNEVRDAIGTGSFARLDSGGSGIKVWAGYSEAIRGAGSTGVGSVWATEIAVMNFATPHSVKGAKPSGGFLGQTHGLLIQTGGGNTNANNADNPLIIGKGGASFHRGIVFYENSIVNPDGDQVEAVLLPRSYCMTWYASGGTDRVFDIRSDINDIAQAQDLVFSLNGMAHRHRLGNTMLSSKYVANSVNYVETRPSVAGQPIQLRAEGTDTNIDILLKPKGNGRVTNEHNGTGSTLHSWRVDLGTNTRSCSLLGPEADSAIDPFIWATGNSWLFRVDSVDALSIDGNGDVVVPTSDFMVGKTSLGGSTEGVELHPTGLINATVSSNVVARFNRLSTDGQIVVFQQGSVPEGDITVSGTTVSYNNFMGAHYSELDAAKGKNLLRGTIVEATGDLVEQRHTRQERLSKFRVCEKAGSKAVYGVVENGAIQNKEELYPGQTEWEGTKKIRKQYMIAAVGAGFIRIGKDEVIEVGDLIENAGKGIGRIQSDDVIRSSTVAKITSTHEVDVYKDGSRLVPCVLYCG